MPAVEQAIAGIRVGNRISKARRAFPKNWRHDRRGLRARRQVTFARILPFANRTSITESFGASSGPLTIRPRASLTIA